MGSSIMKDMLIDSIIRAKPGNAEAVTGNTPDEENPAAH